MADYQAPLREIRFVLNEVFDASTLWSKLDGLKGALDAATADAILEESGKINSALIAPLSREADETGCQWTDDGVKAPPSFKDAYKTYIQGGWCGLTGNPEYEGMGMPKMLAVQFEEMLYSADIAFGLYITLTAGACMAIDAHASDELKQKYLPKMYSGEWSGAMDLTEPHAGSDLGLIRTKAEKNTDGSYSITGSKMFITAGEHDMSENIIHLVLAKLPDAPAGSRGISMFLVPRYLVDEVNAIVEKNSMGCGSIEHKMGIKASATCVMNYDGAKGWLVGEVNKGLMGMFTMMNYERLSVGIQGLGAAERSYQNAAAYAMERRQGRALTGAAEPEAAADPIIVHPDVRRMLLTMKAYTEAGRAFSTYVASFLDTAKFSGDKDERAKADAMVALWTPVAKAYLTDRALDCCVLGQQVFGGHGYVREWGQEQLVRDARITQIYEGTNGIQAMDLIGRKVVANNGAFVSIFIEEVRGFVDSFGESESAPSYLRPFIHPLVNTIELLNEVTRKVVEDVKADPNAAGAAANNYLELLGLTAYAYMWAKIVDVASTKVNKDAVDCFYLGKVKTAEFFYQHLLPKTDALRSSIFAGPDSLMGQHASQFAVR